MDNIKYVEYLVCPTLCARNFREIISFYYPLK